MSPIHQFKQLIFSVLILVFVLSACSGGENTQSAADSAAPASTTIDMSQETADLDFQSFANQAFRFKTEIPDVWAHAENKLPSGKPVINFYPKQGVKTSDLPIVMQTAISLSHIDIFPSGHDAGYPIGKNLRVVLYEGTVPGSGSWDKERSRVYLLGNGEIWAYLLYPQSPPDGWEKEGFIFAQIAIENFSSECFDDVTGYKKSMDTCKPLEGDEVVYYGRLNPEGYTAVQHALEALELKG